MSAIARFLDAFPTVEEVAQKIEELREEIRLLEGYKNARLLVVSRLPLEVLSLIFEHVAHIAKPEKTPAYPSKRYGHWFSITGVCRLWRNVALNTPRLWGHIYAHTKPELARIFLERAKTAPLYIWSLLARSRRETVALWLCNASRLKEIRLAYYPSSSPDWFPLLETLNAPRLEILDLRSEAPKVFEFASNTDSNVAASLRHVKLHNCCFNFRTPLLSQLRSLRVEYDFHDGPQLQMFDVMLALKEMKYLESLELVYSLEFSGAPADLSELSIELPKLTRLCLKAKDPRVLLMLGNFSCPGLQSVTAVVCHGSTACLTSNDVVSTISHAFYTLVPGSEANWNTKLKVTHYGDELINSMIITPGSNSNVDPDLPSSTLTLRNPCDYSATHILLSFLPGNTPNVLDFGFESDRCREAYCDKDALKTFLRSLESVEELHVPHIKDLPVLLMDVPTKTQFTKARRGTRIPFALPSLNRVDVQRFAHVYPQSGDRTYKDLLKALRKRRAINAGIEVMRLNKSYSGPFAPDFVETFQAEVPSLECTLGSSE